MAKVIFNYKGIQTEIQCNINDKIKEIYNGEINHGIFIKKLLIINKRQISDVSAQFNKEFLNKTLGEIYS